MNERFLSSRYPDVLVSLYLTTCLHAIIVGSYVNFSGKVREVRSIFFVRYSAFKCVYH